MTLNKKLSCCLIIILIYIALFPELLFCAPKAKNQNLSEELNVPVQDPEDISFKWTPFQISIWKQIQIFDENYSINGIRFSLPCGINEKITGLDIGLLNMVKHETRGIQVAGFLNISKTLYGLQLGLGNFAERSVHGIQIGVGLNDTDCIYGIQLCALTNNTKNMSGIQIGLANAYVYPKNGENIINSTAQGVQIGGILNFTKRLYGIQICPFVNGAYEVNGIQIGGLLNMAIEMNGVQIGLYNRCKSLRGLQIGVINYIAEREFPYMPIMNFSF
jgi:hypothetical protein